MTKVTTFEYALPVIFIISLLPAVYLYIRCFAAGDQREEHMKSITSFGPHTEIRDVMAKLQKARLATKRHEGMCFDEKLSMIRGLFGVKY